ncbi:MAG: NAD-dependent epimerase/dehydratase family protein [Patescibacteria group bacterium]
MNILITGGVGFIGTNTAIAFAQEPSNTIAIVDNFSRPGVDSNAKYLQKHYTNIEIHKHDVQDVKAYLPLLSKADVVIHLAGQTAVTTSINNPTLDFESNVVGSFRLLEALRVNNPDVILLYSSTNKVYGDLSHHRIELDKKLQQYKNIDYPNGISEDQRLEFISPYGCSKGAFDAYVEDYARIFGMKTVVFRQSCIYGRFQMGVEDQGWVAHFSKQMLLKKPITIFGDGYQVRDLLYVDDLIDAYQRAISEIDQVKGCAFNIGGGTSNAYSLRQVLTLLTSITQTEPQITYDETRSGDQTYFVSANDTILQKLNWRPQTAFTDGIIHMVDWQREYLKL